MCDYVIAPVVVRARIHRSHGSGGGMVVNVSKLLFCLLALCFGGSVATQAQQTTAAPATTAPAQESKSSITGMVSDQNGTGLAGAIVALDNGAGLTQNTTTDAQGLYGLAELPAGSYTVSVTYKDAKIFQAKVTLSPGQAMTLGISGSPIAQAAPQPPAPQPPSTPPPSTAGSSAPSSPEISASPTA